MYGVSNTVLVEDATPGDLSNLSLCMATVYGDPDIELPIYLHTELIKAVERSWGLTSVDEAINLCWCMLFLQSHEANSEIFIKLIEERIMSFHSENGFSQLQRAQLKQLCYSINLGLTKGTQSIKNAFSKKFWWKTFVAVRVFVQ